MPQGAGQLDRHVDAGAWVTALRAADPDAQRRLYELLLRAARSEVGRRTRGRAIQGPEADDLAHQAASDAMVSVLARLDTFRGESRFSTWVYTFAVFEVSGKVTRHFWTREPPRADAHGWEQLPDRFGFTPEQAATDAAMLLAVRRAVEEDLTARQRDAFVAVVLEGTPLDVLVERWSTNRNAIYKTVFDARRKIRARLVADGYVGEDETR